MSLLLLLFVIVRRAWLQIYSGLEREVKLNVLKRTITVRFTVL